MKNVFKNALAIFFKASSAETENAKSKFFLLSAAKVAGSLIIMTVFIWYVFQHACMTAVSPDSVRFMHFWQDSADKLNSDGISLKNAAKAIYYALEASTGYDMNRGRFVQYVIYGIDGLTRWKLPSPMLNVWMMFILVLNAALIAGLATKSLVNRATRVNIFCVAWAVLVTSSLTISPIILLILYAKYVWVTFVLAFFLARTSVMKVAWLIAAMFTDEIGLFATMIITCLSVMRFCLDYYDLKCVYSSVVRLVRAVSFGVASSFAVYFVFYGISAVVFIVGASGVRGLSYLSAAKVVQTASWFLSAINGLFWRAEVLIFGAATGSHALTVGVGVTVLGIIMAGIWKVGKSIAFSRQLETMRLCDQVREWLYDESCFFYTFWFSMLGLISFAIIPAGVADYTHYSYPAAAVLAVLFIRALADLAHPRLSVLVLLAILVSHFGMLPQAIRLTNNALCEYLFPDKTVTCDDMKAVRQSVEELRAKGTSVCFDTFNNGQEIDFSGTWFYSRVKGYGSAAGPYFPIQGTVRVLLWPAIISARANK